LIANEAPNRPSWETPELYENNLRQLYARAKVDQDSLETNLAFDVASYVDNGKSE